MSSPLFSSFSGSQVRVTVPRELKRLAEKHVSGEAMQMGLESFGASSRPAQGHMGRRLWISVSFKASWCVAAPSVYFWPHLAAEGTHGKGGDGL